MKIYNNKTKVVLVIWLLLLYIPGAIAQELDANIENLKPYRLLIPNLDVLIDSAWANHGMLAYRKNEINVKESNLKMKKRYWTRNFGIQGDTRYGTFNNFSENINSSGTINLASNTTQFNFGVGFYLKIPVFDVYNRKSEIKQAKAELTQAENLVKFQKDEIKETVIRYYEDLILKQNLILIRAKNLSDARVNLEMAKKDYTNGNLVLYEFIRISDITSGIATEYEKAKSALIVAKKLLENITGVKIN